MNIAVLREPLTSALLEDLDTPSVVEGEERLRALREHGLTSAAFTFRAPHAPPHASTRDDDASV